MPEKGVVFPEATTQKFKKFPKILSSLLTSCAVFGQANITLATFNDNNSTVQLQTLDVETLLWLNFQKTSADEHKHCKVGMK